MEFSRLICFIIGLLLCLLGILMSTKRKQNKNALYHSALIEFVAHSILLFPYVYTQTPNSLFRLVESFIETFLISLTKYSGEGYDRYIVESSVSTIAIFNSCYSILFALTNILMLIYAADILLHLIEGPYQEIKLYKRRKGKVFLFSECNSKTIAIAESILSKSKDKTAIVFSTSEDKLSDARKESLRKIDAIIMKMSVSDIFLHLNGKAKEVEVFLFSENEESNLQEMEKIGLQKTTKTIIRLFCEVNATPWSLYDDFIVDITSRNQKMTINLVRTEENFIYNLLLDESIFEDAYAEGDTRKIKVLIIGFNERNIEFLKAILHLGQMPGFELSIVMIEDGNHINMLKQMMPELCEVGGGYGDAIYSFVHIPDVPYDSILLDDCVGRDYSDFTYAFINVADDIKSLNLAMRVNAQRNRALNNLKFRTLVNVENRALSNAQKMNKNLTKNMKFVGDKHDVYDYDFITMSSIEKATIEIHKIRYKNKKTWKEYCNKEYNRHSVYARTLSFAYKVKIIDENENTFGNYSLTSTDYEWKVYEHMRWNMYTRTMGYIKASDSFPRDENGHIPGDIRRALKIHESLIPFEELSEEEKSKDELELVDDTVKALKSCFIKQH